MKDFLKSVFSNFVAAICAVIGIGLIIIGAPISCLASLMANEAGWLFIIPLLGGLFLLAIAKVLSSRR